MSKQRPRPVEGPVGAVGQSKSFRSVLCLLRGAAGRHKGIEDTLLAGEFSAHMLRMPLHTKAEGMVAQLHGFCESIVADGDTDQSFAQPVQCLMVHGIDRFLLGSENTVQQCTGLDRNRMNALAAFGKIIVICLLEMPNVLMKCTSEIHIHQLDSPANTQDWLACGEKDIQHLPLAGVPKRIWYLAFFRADLSVQLWIDVRTSGQKQTVTGEHPGNSFLRILQRDDPHLCAGAP